MSKKPKPTTKAPFTVPAWMCPKCGATHPITVPTCCKPVQQAEPFRPLGPMEAPNPYDRYRFPPNWPFGPIICNGGHP